MQKKDFSKVNLSEHIQFPENQIQKFLEKSSGITWFLFGMW